MGRFRAHDKWIHRQPDHNGQQCQRKQRDPDRTFAGRGTNPNSDSDTCINADTDTYRNAESNPDTYTDADTCNYANPDSESDSNTYTNADAGNYIDSYTDSDTYANADTDANTDSDACSYHAGGNPDRWRGGYQHADQREPAKWRF